MPSQATTAIPSPSPIKKARKPRCSPAQLKADLQVKMNSGKPTKAERIRWAKFQAEASAPTPGTPSSLTVALNNDSHLRKGKRGAQEHEQGPRFQHADYENVVAYLEIESNRRALFGSHKKTPVTGQSMNVGTAYKIFGAHISALHNERPKSPSSSADLMNLTGGQMCQRLESYRAKFIRTRNWHNSTTGAGVTEADIEAGITTIEQKLEKMCECYSRMELIYGKRANVTAFGLYSNLDDEETAATEADGEEESEEEFIQWEESEAGEPHLREDGLVTVGAGGDDSLADNPTPPITPNASTPNEPTQKEHTEPHEDDQTDFDERIARAIQSPIPEDQIPKGPAVNPPATPKDSTPNEPARKEDTEPEMDIIGSASALGRAHDDDGTEFNSPITHAIRSPTPEDQTRQRPAVKRQASQPASPRHKTPGPSNKKARARQTLSERPLDPLPSLNPDQIQGKKGKSPLAAALVAGAAAKAQANKENQAILATSQKLRREVEREKMDKEDARHTAALAWEKKRFELERLDRTTEKDNQSSIIKQKIDLAKEWREQGLSAAEIVQLMSTIFPQ